MQITITKKHEFMTGWTAYDMTWKSEFPGVRNKTIQSVGVVTKDPFSTKILKAWASEKGYDLDDMKRMLDQAGMEFVRAFDTDTGKEVTMDSERITVIAKEKFMEGKLYINE